MMNHLKNLDTTITVATPEGVILSAPLANILQRMWALLIDLLIIFVILFAIIFVLAIYEQSRAALGLAAVAMFVVLWGYFFLCEYFFAGKTLGKRALNIRVVSENLTPLTLQGALWRNVLRYIDFLPACFGVGLFFILFSKKNQRFGDWATGVVVIHEEKIFRKVVPIKSAAEPIPWTLNHLEKQTLIVFARYAEHHSSERSEEMAACFHAALPDLSNAQRVEKLCAFAAWIEQGGRAK